MSGWHIANARDVQWHDAGHFGVYCDFQQDEHFEELGFGLGMCCPGQPVRSTTVRTTRKASSS